MGLWISIPEELILNFSVSALGVMMTLLLFLNHYRHHKNFFQSQFFNYFASHFLTVFLIAIILALVNYFAYKNPLFWDLSKHQRAGLTEQSRQVLKSLKNSKETIRFIVLAPKTSLSKIKALLDLYRLENSSLEFEFIDAELRPDKVRKYEVSEVPKIIVESGSRLKKVEELSELAITNALIKISRPHDPLICYIKGHDEMNFDSVEAKGGSELKKIIQNSGFDLRVIHLKDLKEIEKKIDLLVIWGPKSGFVDSEINILDQYLKKGGRLLLALDPQFKKDPLVNLRTFLKSRGLSVPNNLIVDRIKHVNGSGGSIPVIAEYGKDHPLLKNSKEIVFFPLVSSVMPTQKPKRGYRVDILAFSSPFPAAWGDSEPGSLYKGKIVYNEEEDLKGPLGYFGISYGTETKAQLMLFGNSTFVANAYRKYPRNFTLFMNTLHGLADENRLISFDLPMIEEKPVFINKHQIGLIFYTVMIAFPLILFGVAFYFYRRKRIF